MSNILFSVLSYYRSFIANENLHVGVAFFNLDTLEAKMIITNNWTRIRYYDDELDIDMFKMLLNGIKNSYENKILNDEMSLEEKKNYLNRFIRFYVNELKFSKPLSVQDDNFDEFIAKTKGIYLKSDVEKSKRLSKDEQLTYMKQLIKGANSNYSTAPVVGQYGENLRFDYIVDGKYGIKYFNFNDSNLKYIVRDLKSWSYTAAEIQNSLEVIFIYDINGLSDDKKLKLDKIINILKKNTEHVYSITEGIEFINKNLINTKQIKFTC